MSTDETQNLEINVGEPPVPPGPLYSERQDPITWVVETFRLLHSDTVRFFRNSGTGSLTIRAVVFGVGIAWLGEAIGFMIRGLMDDSILSMMLKMSPWNDVVDQFRTQPVVGPYIVSWIHRWNEAMRLGDAAWITLFPFFSIARLLIVSVLLWFAVWLAAPERRHENIYEECLQILAFSNVAAFWGAVLNPFLGLFGTMLAALFGFYLKVVGFRERFAISNSLAVLVVVSPTILVGTLILGFIGVIATFLIAL